MPNRLADETSPYLRQHADNPVDWWPFGDEAFELARRTDRPVLISVGYSSCHWCHVMAHESFEDPDTAALINDRFVPIKVDREERPDVDAVYMEATQAMVGRGGWPMTVFADADGRPFFCGTYFPPEPRGGQPGFTQLVDESSLPRTPKCLQMHVPHGGNLLISLAPNGQVHQASTRATRTSEKQSSLPSKKLA